MKLYAGNLQIMFRRFLCAVGLTIASFSNSASDAMANSCFQTFDINPQKSVSLEDPFNFESADMTLSCKVAEKVRAELYVNNPKLFADIAGMSATKYRSDLETQLGKIDDQISDLGLEVSKSGTLGTIEVLYNILEFEVAKYALTMCLVPDVTVTKFSCVIGLLGTIKGGRDILTGDISRNAQLERVEELRKALRKERQRFESVRQKIVAASLDEAEKRTEATFYRLCRQIETSCLR